MTTIDELFESLGGTSAVATLCGAAVQTASNWRVREVIPLRIWPILIHEAKAREIEGVTADMLLNAHVEAQDRRAAQTRRHSAA